jgi:hypothetical protein
VSEARIGVGDDPRPIRKKAPTTAIVAVIQSILETSMLRRRGSPERTIPSCGLSELIHEGSHNRDQIQRSRIIGVPARMVLLDTQLGRGGYPSLDGVRPAAHTGPHLLARASRCSRPPGISLVRATSKFHGVSIGPLKSTPAVLERGQNVSSLPKSGGPEMSALTRCWELSRRKRRAGLQGQPKAEAKRGKPE